MFVTHRLIRRNEPMGLATCLAIDAGCLVVAGISGLVSFGFAWIVLKSAGII